MENKKGIDINFNRSWAIPEKNIAMLGLRAYFYEKPLWKGFLLGFFFTLLLEIPSKTKLDP